VFAYADLRRDRGNEVLAQRSDVVSFLGSVVGLNAQRHRWTYELLLACHDAAAVLAFRLKQALGCLRPVEYSAQIQPMILTPMHGTLPSGHATQSFLIALLLAEFVSSIDSAAYKDANTDNRIYRRQLLRQASRIAVNRVVAGVHFPVDNAAGQVLGIALAQWFLHISANVTGGTQIPGWRFDGSKYGDEDVNTNEIQDKMDTPAEPDLLYLKHKASYDPAPKVASRWPGRRLLEYVRTEAEKEWP
jgi:hypothetical protein